MASRRKNWLIPAALVLGCMAAVWCFSAQNGDLSSRLSQGALEWVRTVLPGVYRLLEQAGNPEYLLRKLAHFSEYLALGLLLYTLLRRRLSPGRAALLAVVLAAGFAATDEWHQLSVPGRDGNLRDVCIDTAGATAGAVLGRLVTWLRRPPAGR